MQTIRTIRESRFLRPLAGLFATLCLTVWYAAPTAAALQEPAKPEGRRTQTPDAKLRRKIAEQERAKQRQPDLRELTEAELAGVRGRAIRFSD